MEKATFIAHYASPYYDPVKAHEYYEEHKKLKGRSTSGLNDKGKEALAYVKDRLTTEKDNRTSASRSVRDRRIENAKGVRSRGSETLSDKLKTNLEIRKRQKDEAVARHKESMQNEIDSLNSYLNSLSKEQKSENKERIKKKIEELREKNGIARNKLNEAYKKDSDSLRLDTKNRKTELGSAYDENVKEYRDTHNSEKESYKKDYEESYARELDSILSDPNFKKAKKTSGKSSGSSKKSSGSSDSGYRYGIAEYKADKAKKKK